MLTMILALSVSASPTSTQQFVVENKCVQKFSVVNRTCPNCTACGTECKCFGGGYYCTEGKCSPTNPLNLSPVGVQQSQPKQYMQVCDGKSCRWVEVPQNQTTFSVVPQTFGTAPNFGSFGDTGFSTTYGNSSNNGGAVEGRRTGPIRSFFQRIRGVRSSRSGAGNGCSSCGG